MEVELPDGNRLTLPDGATGADAAAAIGAGLARAALAVKVDGELRDLSRPLPDNHDGGPAKLEILTDRSGDEALALIRHDAAHVLAAAVMDLYPGVKISIGPAIENGFYYDFDFPEGVSLSEADFEPIEAKMREHIAADETFVREDVPAQEALDRFLREAQDYKVELIEDLIENDGVPTVSLYTNGPFTDLCRGPHAPSTKRIKAFKLQSVAGAYWRGDSNKPMLTRIYGTAFFSDKDLQEYLERLEQARARDHRKLGPQLGLFNFSDVAPGMAFWFPAGTQVFNSLVALSREMGDARGYTEVKTPQLYDSSLWKTSGHWDKYQRAHVPHRVGGHADGAQADELPGPLPALLDAASLLPGPADPLFRAGTAAPQRAERRAPRAAADAELRPGRRPYLLRRGPGTGRARGVPGLRVRHLRDLRLRRSARALDAT